MEANAKKGADYIITPSFEPVDSERPPPYASPKQVNLNIAQYLANTSSYEPEQVICHDVEARPMGRVRKERKELVIVGHKVVVLALMTYFLITFLYGLSEPDDKTRVKLKNLFERDLGLEVNKPEDVISKYMTTVICVCWFVSMCYSVIWERYALLVFSCVLAVVVVMLCIATSALVYIASPELIWFGKLLLSCILGAVMINSMIYLVRVVEHA